MANINEPNRGEDETEIESGSITGSIGRRVIVKGAAWSIPVFAAATAVPLAAASVCTPGTYTAPAPPRGANVSDAKVTSSFVVPPGVRTISYQVAGGAGGANGTSGWSGDLVTGTLTVTPGDILNLVVGQGGVRKPSAEYTTPGTLLTGGKGFGDGGDSNGVPTSTTPSAGTMLYNQGGSGGGGSAIQLNGSLVVVAGGAEGQGGNQDRSPGVDGEWTTSNIPNGSRWTHTTRSVWVQTTYGGDASGATPGAAGNVTGGSAQGTAATPLVYEDTNTGSAGGAVSVNGGKGGNSRPIWFRSSALDTVIVSTPGAGGGGYAGGGSGGITSATFSINGETRLMDQTFSSGGRGSSYLAPGIAGTISQRGASNNAQSPQRGPGYITLSWGC